MLVSFVIPVLNSEKTLAECLDAIQAQTIPSGVEREIVIADAGSTDGTLDIARAHGVDVITDNPLKTGEAGKTAGIKAAHGDVIALVDSDNILPDPTWLARMTAPFADPDIGATEPIAYTARPQDPAPTRYFALLGMNDPICLFTRNYDRTCGVTGKWTGLAVPAEDRGDWLKLTLTADALPTIGANGFVLRRSLLDGTNWDPYLFDIDILYERIRRDGSVYVAKVKTGIILFCLSTVTLIPLLIQMLIGFCRKPDRAWLYHVPVCWITLWVYGWGALAKLFGRKQSIADRTTWQKN